jgi:hypothetical protein
MSVADILFVLSPPDTIIHDHKKVRTPIRADFWDVHIQPAWSVQPNIPNPAIKPSS